MASRSIEPSSASTHACLRSARWSHRSASRLQMRDLADPDAVAADAAQAAELGYQQLYSYDHLGSVDPFVPMVTAARAAPDLRRRPARAEQRVAPSGAAGPHRGDRRCHDGRTPRARARHRVHAGRARRDEHRAATTRRHGCADSASHCRCCAPARHRRARRSTASSTTSTSSRSRRQAGGGPCAVPDRRARPPDGRSGGRSTPTSSSSPASSTARAVSRQPGGFALADVRRPRRVVGHRRRRSPRRHRAVGARPDDARRPRRRRGDGADHRALRRRGRAHRRDAVHVLPGRSSRSSTSSSGSGKTSASPTTWSATPSSSPRSSRRSPGADRPRCARLGSWTTCSTSSSSATATSRRSRSTARRSAMRWRST